MKNMKKRNGTQSQRRILALAAVGGMTVAALIGVAVLLWQSTSTGAETPDLPVFVLDRPEPVRVAYAYAIAHPEVSTRIPCCCGCVNLGTTAITTASSGRACRMARSCSTIMPRVD